MGAGWRNISLSQLIRRRICHDKSSGRKVTANYLAFEPPQEAHLGPGNARNSLGRLPAWPKCLTACKYAKYVSGQQVARVRLVQRSFHSAKKVLDKMAIIVLQ